MIYYGNFYRYNNYNAKEAVRYALTYALTPNNNYRFFASYGDGGGNCTNFISQCLKAGGAPFAYDIYPWWYKKDPNNSMNDKWSLSWAVAHSLYWTLKSRNERKLKGLRAIEVPSIEMLKIGDVIQYENFKKVIYHSAIITAMTINKGVKIPLISQNTYNARNISYIKPQAKQMHFMKIEVV
ncbi:Putative amidase domain-containing protein [Clostridium sp. USBA 49]|jgi:hypothetical protein|uniref:amidase domain-containing protein n=1 Tax=Clostridium TaxID=1485 RepID=UPI00099ABE80|nr:MULTISPECIES: amidase domain-containing protein [Clostridium]SKA83924.1 Putative amidase domain-containing protein [Clostridium sp. USBA 49]